MSGEAIYVHTWSNGDISVLCYQCVGVPTLNHNFRTNYDYRTYTRNLGFTVEDITNMMKFVGCIHCKRGAEVIPYRKSLYRLDFNPRSVEVWFSDNYLGGNNMSISNWAFTSEQGLYNGNW